MNFRMHLLFSLAIILFTCLPHTLAESTATYFDGTKRIIMQKTHGPGILSIEEIHEIIKDDEEHIIIEANWNELSKLRKEPGLTFIGFDKQINTFLQDARGIVNASKIWNLTSANTPLNGTGRSVCVVDTGIDTNHADFTGKILAQYCYCSANEGGASSCCPDETNEDTNATDNHGHGTHVSGIVAASGGIQGIGTELNIVAVKILNSTGVGFDSDLKSAIEWCSNDTNVATYNISAISLSLGGGQYNSEASCISADAFNVRSAINAAVAKNISVVTATGNTNAVYTDNTAGIASPACLPNTTRVTASDKSDGFASYAFRNSNFSDILIAPGSNINSTQLGGGYVTDSGTSMATPIVSGIIGLLTQYFNLSSQYKNTTQIATLLNDTGRILDDTANSGTNFSRVNGYEAILDTDINAPNSTLISPANLHVNASGNHTFICNGSDWQLANVTLTLWNSTGLYMSQQENSTGETNQTTIPLTNIPAGTYEWNCEYTDIRGASASSSSNFSFTVGGISTTLFTPVNETYTNNNSLALICNFSSQAQSTLTNATTHLWNATNATLLNETQNISGTTNSTTSNYNLTNEGNYTWNCHGINNLSNSSWATHNYTLTYDITNPGIANVSTSSISSSGATLSWETNETTNYSITGDISSSNASFEQNRSITFSGLTASTTYSITLTTCDRANNCNTTNESFTTSAEPTSGSGGSGSSGGSSGGGGGSIIQTLTKTETTNGVTKTFTQGSSARFTIGTKNHTITTTKITPTIVSLTITSNPIHTNMSIGEKRKFNITNKTHYDLSIHIQSITANKANITIETINEAIQPTQLPNRNNNEIGILTNKNNTTKTTIDKELLDPKIIPISIIITAIIYLTIIGIIKRKHLQRRKHTKKQRKHHDKKKNTPTTQTKRTR